MLEAETSNICRVSGRGNVLKPADSGPLGWGDGGLTETHHESLIHGYDGMHGSRQQESCEEFHRVFAL